MFNHLIKDYQSKIAEVEERLKRAADPDERRALALKLKFHSREVNHYVRLVTGLKTRVEAVKLAYGFEWEGEEEPSGSPRAAEETSNETETPDGEFVPEAGDGEGGNGAVAAGERAPEGTPGPEAGDLSKELAVVPEDAESEGGEARSPDGGAAGESRDPEEMTQVFPYAFVFDVLDWINRAGKNCSGALLDVVEGLPEERRRRLSLAMELNDPVGQIVHDGAPEELTGHLNVLMAAYCRTAGLHEEKRRFLMAAAQTAIHSPALLFLLGEEARRSGDARAAAMHFVSALLKEETFGRARLALAEIYREQGRFDKAIDVLPDEGFDGPARRRDAALFRADTRIRMDRFEEAVAELNALDGQELTDPQKALRFRLRGMAESKLERPLEAVEALEKAYALEPDDPELNFELGRLYWTHNARALARRHLDFLRSRFPDSTYASRAAEWSGGGSISET